MQEKKLRQKALRSLYDMAFGSADALKLLFLPEDEAAALEDMDLRQVLSIHKASSGGFEIKLCDRAKLIELLLEATEDAGRDSGRESLGYAMNSAAERLGTVRLDRAGEPDAEE